MPITYEALEDIDYDITEEFNEKEYEITTSHEGFYGFRRLDPDSGAYCDDDAINGWRLYISVNHKQIAKAFNAISAILLDRIISFKIIKSSALPQREINFPARMKKGMQFTLYLKRDQHGTPEMPATDLKKTLIQKRRPQAAHILTTCPPTKKTPNPREIPVFPFFIKTGIMQAIHQHRLLFF
jgi:hypothetical protein